MINLPSPAPNAEPTSWRTVTVGEIADSKGGYAFPHRYQGTTSGPYPFFKVSDMNRVGNEILMSQAENWVSKETVAALRAKLFPAGAVVFPKIGAALRTNKKRILSSDSLVDNNVMALVVRDESQCLPKFLYYFLLTVDLADLSNPGTVPSLTSSRIKSLPISLPPLDEQRKIAAVLSLVQRAIEQQERLITLTAELKQSLMHKLFTEGLHGEPQKVTEIGPVPESWSVCRLIDVCELQRGFDITKKDQTYGSIPVVSSGGINSFHDVAKVKGPGVVIGRKGTLGTVHYVPSDFWPHDTTLWVKDFKGNNPRFVSYLLKTLRLDRFDTGASNPTLNRNGIHPLPVAIAEWQEQKEIASALAILEEKEAIHDRKRAALYDLFQTLLHQLMTAQIRLDNLDLSAL